MAEYVSTVQYQTDLAHLDARFDRLESLLTTRMAQLQTDMAQMELRLERSWTRIATIAGLAAGVVSAIPAYIAVTMALVRVFSGP